MSFEDDENDLAFGRAKPKKSYKRSNQPNIGLLALGIVLIVGLGFSGFKLYQTYGNSQSAAKSDLLSYRTIGRVDFRSSPSNTAAIKSVLKEGTMLSGKSAGSKDGIEWVEATSVDGVHGYIPLASVRIIGAATDLRQLVPDSRRIVTSTAVNIRALPSLSAPIKGTIDGGSRLVADGTIMSEGEQWLRLPLSPDVTGFIMARFTTPDDDKAGSAEGFEGPGAVGVGGVVTKVMNVQATPFEGARIIRPLAVDEQVRVLGQTTAGVQWYVIRLADGVQGFIPKDAIRVSETANRWVYPDGSPAPGPNIPQTKNGVLVKPNTKAKSASNSGGAEPVIVDMSVPVAPDDANNSVNPIDAPDSSSVPPINE